MSNVSIIFPLFSLLDRETPSIIDHSGHDSSRAATSWFVLSGFVTKSVVSCLEIIEDA